MKNEFFKGRNEANWINKKQEKVFRISDYTENLLILASTVTGCVSISAIASLVVTSVGIASSTALIKICAITARIKSYMWRISIKKKKHEKIILLAKPKLNNI